MGDFQASYRGIGELLRSAEMEAEMVRRAEKVKAAAEAIAPYDPDSTDGTHYKDAFRVESTRRGGLHQDRAAASVVNDDDAAFFIEFGNRNIPRKRVLGNAMHAAGD